MNINLDSNLISLIAAGLAFFASLIATGVSIYNARFRKFVSEKWWHRKSEAYIKIIDDLTSSIVYLENLYEALEQDAPERIIQEIRQREKQEFKKYLGVHTLKTEGLFICIKASDELKKLEKKLYAIWVDGYAGRELEETGLILDAKRQALSELVPIAKKDLRVG